MDRQAAANAIRDFLQALGHPAEGERADTPERVADAWCDELLSGYQHDPQAILEAAAIEPTGSRNDAILVRDLHLASICPHHLLPTHGQADILYLPGQQWVGFGAIARALDSMARRLVLQEQLGQEMANLLVAALGARGAICRLRLQHSCMQLRGPQQTTAEVITLTFAGCYADSNQERAVGIATLGGQRT